MDLGYKDSGYPTSIGPSEGDAKTKEEPPVYYPSINLRGDAAEALCEGCAAGDTFTATVKMRVVEKTERAEGRQPYNDREGARIELELVSMDAPGMKKGKKAAKDDNAEDAVDSYLSNKQKASAEEDDELA